ncbi:MAG: PilZ domain-containing protein [Candidatus Hydrogenedentes bacterium]|nr:PilZ domain-containing protein [Candidatus Hydrogenedentota bacterium]
MNESNLHREQRRSKRVQITTEVRYQISRELGGTANLVNVDQGGICMLSTFPLPVGHHVMLEVKEPRRGEGSVELKGRVAWCVRDGMGYRAGVKVYQDDCDVRIVLSALMCAALKTQAAIARLRNTHFVYVEWKLAALAASEGAGPSGIWKKREPAKRSVGRVLALGY